MASDCHFGSLNFLFVKFDISSTSAFDKVVIAITMISSNVIRRPVEIMLCRKIRTNLWKLSFYLNHEIVVKSNIPSSGIPSPRNIYKVYLVKFDIPSIVALFVAKLKI